jgi:hypothetical protein
VRLKAPIARHAPAVIQVVKDMFTAQRRNSLSISIEVDLSLLENNNYLWKSRSEP